MKKIIILASLALVAGIYSFNKSETVVQETEEKEPVSVKKAKREVASISSHSAVNPVYNYSDNQQTYVPDNEPINCLNYDGDDICQNDYASQETFPEETYAQVESEPVEEQAIQEFEDSTITDYERDANENALVAANPIQEEE